MRLPTRWGGLVLLACLVLLLATYFGLVPPINNAVLWLASQPGVTNAFADPVNGATDALLTLISFALLTPFLAFVLTLLLVFMLTVIMGFTEPMMRALRVPTWITLVPVSASGVGAAFMTKEYWMPKFLETLGFVARAYVVWSASGPS